MRRGRGRVHRSEAEKKRKRVETKTKTKTLNISLSLEQAESRQEKSNKSQGPRRRSSTCGYLGPWFRSQVYSWEWEWELGWAWDWEPATLVRPYGQQGSVHAWTTLQKGRQAAKVSSEVHGWQPGSSWSSAVQVFFLLLRFAHWGSLDSGLSCLGSKSDPKKRHHDDAP